MISNLVFAQEYKMKVFNVVSSQKSQQGNETTLSIDGNYNTMYHSVYGVSGIPDQLDFRFSPKVKSIKALTYYPRMTGLNGIWTNIDIYYSTQANPNNFVKVNTNPITWVATNTSKRYDFPNTIQNPAIIRVKINAGYANFSSCAEMEFFSDEQMSSTTTECTLPTAEFNNVNDISIKPNITGSTASNFQNGQNIEKSFDGNITTLYHSHYTNTIFPVSLIYNFDGATPIDYLKYTPRQDGGVNGLFGNIKVSYNTLTNPNYISIATSNFEQNNNIRRIEFFSSITPLNIKIEVLDGRNNFASCAEMEFFQKNPNAFNPDQYANIFSNNLFSELNPNITQNDINAITSPYIKNLAQCLFNNTYNKKYRVQTLSPYRTIQSINNEYKIGDYNPFENPLGLVFQANTTAVIFVNGISTNNPVSLRIRDFATEGATTTDKSYSLTNGINIIPVTNSGLGYITYFTDEPNASPISLNATTGIVNGIYKKGISPTEWIEMLTNDVYPKIDIEGYYTKIIMDKAPLATYHYNDVQPLVDKYDIIAKSERELMGFFKYNKNIKNRQLVYTENSGGWFAGGIGAHLDLSWGTQNSASATGLDIWGVAHELGHINQVRPSIKWIGTTEVTNNIYTAWAAYNLYTPIGANRYTTIESHNGLRTSFPAVAGNRYGEIIISTLINGNNIMADHANASFTSDEKHFRTLVPFWQLELYYQLAGASKGAPTLGIDTDMSDEATITTTATSSEIDYAHWLATVINKTIATNENQLSDGQLSMNFVKNVCDAVQEDLTDFFTKTGFLRPINGSITQYGTTKAFVVTQAMIDDTKNYIAEKNYPKPVSPVINYISAHSLNSFKNLLPLSGITGEGAQITGQFLKVTNSKWLNAVAFETYNSNNQLISVSILGTNDTTLVNTYVDYPAGADKVYAVGYDGQKILVYPVTSLATTDLKNNELVIYPNPLKLGSKLNITLKNANSNLICEVHDLVGNLILKTNGNLDNITTQVNGSLQKLKTGVYTITINDGKQKHQSKIIKE